MTQHIIDFLYCTGYITGVFIGMLWMASAMFIVGVGGLAVMYAEAFVFILELTEPYLKKKEKEVSKLKKKLKQLKEGKS